MISNHHITWIFRVRENSYHPSGSEFYHIRGGHGSTSVKTISSLYIPAFIYLSNSVSLRRIFTKHPPHLTSPCSAPTRIRHITHGEPVEMARGTHGIRTHVIKSKPVSHPQGTWQQCHRTHTVDRIACGTPNAACPRRFRWCHMKRPIQR